MAITVAVRLIPDSRIRLSRNPASGCSSQSTITHEKGCFVPFSMDAKMSVQSSAWIPDSCSTAFSESAVSGFLENNKARRAISG